MSLRLYNTFSRQKEIFTPLKKGVVTMYHCGPTVYGPSHIGNLRHYILADTLGRFLRHKNLNTKQVINITDVGHLVSDGDEGEDKMEKAAGMQGTSPSEIASFYTELFLTDLASLGIDTKKISFPKATETIKEQIKLIEKLEKKGFTYTTSDGVYFDTSRFPSYGELAQLNLEGQKEGARILENKEKRSREDFALWKFSKEKGVRKQEWDSPWGVGFPGWHTECSAMAMNLLGETIDIHTSGVDHIPTHHTNERAQSEAATGKRFVRYWLHNEHVLVEGKKMSKSLGNIFTLSDIEKKNISPLAYRYLLLTAHYRTQINFTWDSLAGAARALTKLQEHYLSLGDPLKEKEGALFSSYKERFGNALADDLDTPNAIALIWSLLKDGELTDSEKKNFLSLADELLGLGLKDTKTEPLPPHVEALAEEREHARAQKNWEDSDALREKIEKEGFSVKDTPQGQVIVRTLVINPTKKKGSFLHTLLTSCKDLFNF